MRVAAAVPQAVRPRPRPPQPQVPGDTFMRPSVLVTRATFPDIADRLREHFDVEDNPSDTIWSQPELIRRLQGKRGVMSTGSERIDAVLLDACPELKAVANVGVGYNNVD